MNVSCSHCPAKFAIPDARVRGRKVRMQCKRCGKPIVIDGTELGPDTSVAPPAPVAAPTRSPAPAAAVPAPAPAPPTPRPANAVATPATPTPLAGPTHAPPGPSPRRLSNKQTILGGLQAPIIQPPPEPPAPPPKQITQTLDWFVAVNHRDPTQMALTQLVELYVLGAVDANTAVWRVDDPTRRRPFDFQEIAEALEARGITPPEPEPREELPSFTEETGEETVIASPSLRERFPELRGYPEPGAAASAHDADDEVLSFDERTVAVDSAELLSSFNRQTDHGGHADHDAGLGVARLPDDPEFTGVPTPPAPPRQHELAAAPPAPEPEPLPPPPSHPDNAAATNTADGQESPPPPPPQPEAPPRPPAPQEVDSPPLSASTEADSDEWLQPQRKRGCAGRLFRIGLITLLLLAAATVALYFYDRDLMVQYVPALREMVPDLFPAPPAPAANPVPAPPSAAPSPEPSGSGTSPADAGAGGAPPGDDAAAAKEAAPPREAGPFDQQAALAALAKATEAARKCYDPELDIQTGRVIVSFEPSGRVSNVVPQAALAGNKVGLCVAGYYRDIRIPPFIGERVPIAHPVQLR